ncbi:MAG: pilus assembly protein PilP [Deltaproteobacteria bacterium]
MKDKKTIVLAVVLLALVGIYAFVSYKSEQRKKPTGKAGQATSLTPEQEMQKKVILAIRSYQKDTQKVPRNLQQLKGKYLDEKTYTGKPDPFKPFILASAASEESPVVVHRQLTPLQKMPLSEIQAGLKAIIWGQLGSKALVEDATGKGYVVQEGTYVGQHDGIVKKIYQDRIVVEEYRRDPAKGRLEPTEVVLRLKKVEKK